MKKILATVLAFALCVSMAPSQHVHAEEMIDPETGFRYEEIVSGYDAAPDFEWEKEIIVYVDNSDDIKLFERNPNYRYIFQWEEPVKARLACNMCGNSQMTTVNQRVQWAGDYLQCPLTAGAGLYNDDFLTFYKYINERCRNCGYTTAQRRNGTDYEAHCNNGTHPGNASFWTIVPTSQFVKGVHDNHQYLPWWQNKILP